MNVTWLYVGGIYALSVLLARRAGVALPRRVAFLFYALVVVWLFRPLTTSSVNLATDVLHLAAPWSAAAPGASKYTVSNIEGQDIVFQMQPWAVQVRDAWKSLSPPLWNSAAGCGLPLLANGQSEGLSPIRLLALPLPEQHLLAAAGAFKILAALTFTFLFLRRRFDVLPSVTGAIAFGFCGWMAVWLNFPQSTTGAFLPAVLLMIDLLAERVTHRRVVVAAALGPVVFFSGHPETAAHMVFYGALFAVWHLVVSPANRRRFAIALAIAAVAGLFMAAPVVAPFLETVRKSVRYAQVATGFNERGTPYSDFPSLVPMLQPRFFGTRPAAVAWGPATAETIAGFAGLAGVAAWALLLVRAFRRREWKSFELWLASVMVVVFALIDDWPVVSRPFRELFMLANNHRLRLMFAFLVAAMLAALLHHARRERWLALAAPLSGLAILAVIVWRIVFPHDAAKAFALQTTIPSLITLGCVALTFGRWRVVHAAVAVSLFAELWVVGHHWNPVFDAQTLAPRTPLIEAVLEKKGRDPERIAGIGGVLFPNTHVAFGLEDARVHDPMALQRYASFLALTMPGYDTNEYYPKFKDAGAPVLDYLNVRWLLTDPGVQMEAGSRYRLVYEGADGRLFENLHVLPRFYAARNVILTPDPAGLATIDWRTTAFAPRLPAGDAIERDLLQPRPHDAPVASVAVTRRVGDGYELLVDAPRHTLVVSSVSEWPGWRVRHNGVSLESLVVNGHFLGFVVPPGRGVVTVAYVPASFWGGVALALATMMVLALPAVRRAPGVAE